MSSTTRMVSRRTSGAWVDVVLAMFAHSFQHVHVALEIEIRDQRAHAGRKGLVGRGSVSISRSLAWMPRT